MKIRRIFRTALTLAFIILPLWVQLHSPLHAETPPVFAPFVSDLQGEVRRGLIRLSWRDSPDIKGPVYIYRSTSPFEGADPMKTAGTEPVKVEYGVQSHVDEIEAPGTFYYFAVASDVTGRTYQIPIASTNTIAVLIAPGSAIPVPAPVVAEKSPADKPPALPPGISALEAAAYNDRVVITFNQGNTKNIILYRSIRPIAHTQDLLAAVILQTRISSPFTDFPVAGIPYYYAAVPENDLIQGTVEITPGRNATKAAVQIAGMNVDPNIRAIPLPQLSTQAVAPGVNSYPERPPVELSPAAASALGNTPANPDEPALKKPRVFARDLETPQAIGEDYTLSTIINGPFMSKDWEKAREQLSGFLSTPRSPETRARARFYLGQSCYFLRQPRDGLFEFLSIQSRFPAETAEWIQASLDMLKR